jgi:nicotinamidase-related amidase
MENAKALLIIDMQNGSFTSKAPRFDADGVVRRINGLGAIFRRREFPVIFVQHDGSGTGEFERDTFEWQLLRSLEISLDDVVVGKTANDTFYKSRLELILNERKVTELFITGCATDFCVDSTVQSAIARDYSVTIVADGHTTADRPHLGAAKIIEHYNWVWRNMIPTKGKIDVKTFERIRSEFQI